MPYTAATPDLARRLSGRSDPAPKGAVSEWLSWTADWQHEDGAHAFARLDAMTIGALRQCGWEPLLAGLAVGPECVARWFSGNPKLRTGTNSTERRELNDDEVRAIQAAWEARCHAGRNALKMPSRPRRDAPDAGTADQRPMDALDVSFFLRSVSNDKLRLQLREHFPDASAWAQNGPGFLAAITAVDRGDVDLCRWAMLGEVGMRATDFFPPVASDAELWWAPWVRRDAELVGRVFRLYDVLAFCGGARVTRAVWTILVGDATPTRRASRSAMASLALFCVQAQVAPERLCAWRTAGDPWPHWSADDDDEAWSLAWQLHANDVPQQEAVALLATDGLTEERMHSWWTSRKTRTAVHGDALEWLRGCTDNEWVMHGNPDVLRLLYPLSPNTPPEGSLLRQRLQLNHPGRHDYAQLMAYGETICASGAWRAIVMAMIAGPREWMGYLGADIQSMEAFVLPFRLTHPDRIARGMRLLHTVLTLAQVCPDDLGGVSLGMATRAMAEHTVTHAMWQAVMWGMDVAACKWVAVSRDSRTTGFGDPAARTVDLAGIVPPVPSDVVWEWPTASRDTFVPGVAATSLLPYVCANVGVHRMHVAQLTNACLLWGDGHALAAHLPSAPLAVRTAWLLVAASMEDPGPFLARPETMLAESERASPEFLRASMAIVYAHPSLVCGTSTVRAVGHLRAWDLLDGFTPAFVGTFLAGRLDLGAAGTLALPPIAPEDTQGLAAVLVHLSRVRDRDQVVDRIVSGAWAVLPEPALVARALPDGEVAVIAAREGAPGGGLVTLLHHPAWDEHSRTARAWLALRTAVRRGMVGDREVDNKMLRHLWQARGPHLHRADFPLLVQRWMANQIPPRGLRTLRPFPHHCESVATRALDEMDRRLEAIAATRGVAGPADAEPPGPRPQTLPAASLDDTATVVLVAPVADGGAAVALAARLGAIVRNNKCFLTGIKWRKDIAPRLVIAAPRTAGDGYTEDNNATCWGAHGDAYGTAGLAGWSAVTGAPVTVPPGAIPLLCFEQLGSHMWWLLAPSLVRLLTGRVPGQDGYRCLSHPYTGVPLVRVPEDVVQRVWFRDRASLGCTLYEYASDAVGFVPVCEDALVARLLLVPPRKRGAGSDGWSSSDSDYESDQTPMRMEMNHQTPMHMEMDPLSDAMHRNMYGSDSDDSL